jgi:hypothetical protein
MIDTKPKVVIDSEIDNSTPSIAVTAPQNYHDEADTKQTPDILSLPARIIKKITTFILDFLETIVVALSIFVVVYLFLVQPHEVKGSSMEPNFHNNEYILTDKLSYKLRDPSGARSSYLKPLKILM